VNRWGTKTLLVFLGLPIWSVGAAAVSDLTFTDVTDRAVSVVWAFDEPVSDGTVRVFADSAGTVELTGGLQVSLISSAFPPALADGIVKVDISGLVADTCVYVQTETTASAVDQFPAAAPFLEVCTEVAAARENGSGGPIVNDILAHDLFQPDELTPADGALLLISAPGVGSYPLAAFVGQEVASPATLVDLNNLFDAATGTSAELAGGEVVQMTEFRGLLCPGLASHQRVRYRRAPDHEEVPFLGLAVPEIEVPPLCFFADTLCDDVVDILDVQRVLTIFGSQPGECEFNPDLDIVADQVINILDAQSVLNRFGESAPFGP
jgi:hypothetical protein